MEAAGEPIEGSALVRAFCEGCGEPIRVTFAAWDSGYPQYCSGCEPRKRGHAATRQSEHVTGVKRKNRD